MVFLLLILTILASTQPLFAQWTHSFADIQSSSFITLPETSSRAIAIPLIDVIETDHFYTSLLSGDVDGDQVNELVALSDNNQHLCVFDFFERKRTTIPLPNGMQDINLLFLTDFDEDGALDIVFESSIESDIWFAIYSSKLESILFEYNHLLSQTGGFNSTSPLVRCTPVAYIDANFDQHKEVITLKSFADGQTRLVMISPMSSTEHTLIETYSIDVSTLVITRSEDFEETYIIFSTDDNGAKTLNAFVIESGSQEAAQLWSTPLRQGDFVSRISASNQEDADPAVYVGTNSINPGQERFFSKLNLFTGDEEQVFSINQWNTVDLSVGDFDGNGLTEATLLTTDSNLRHLDFERQKERIFTVSDSFHYIGGIELLANIRGVEHCTVKQLVNGFEVFMLDFDFSPLFSGSSVKLLGEKASRGILGDFDGNNLGEFVISTETETGPKINRVYFADPSLPPFPLDPMTSILDWKIY